MNQCSIYNGKLSLSLYELNYIKFLLEFSCFHSTNHFKAVVCKVIATTDYGENRAHALCQITYDLCNQKPVTCHIYCDHNIVITMITSLMPHQESSCIWWSSIDFLSLARTVYPKKYAHGFVVLCFVVVMQSFILNSHEVFIHIHQGCFAGTGAIVRLLQCQWSKLDGYGKISQCITTTKHSKARTVCIFIGIYCSQHQRGFVCKRLWLM